MDGRPDQRNKAAFSNFSAVVWMLLSEQIISAKRLPHSSFREFGAQGGRNLKLMSFFILITGLLDNVLKW